MTGFAAQFPQASLEIKRAIAEGDLVVTHSLLNTSPADRGTAAADILRLEDGKIVEHWDLLLAAGPGDGREREHHVLTDARDGRATDSQRGNEASGRRALHDR